MRSLAPAAAAPGLKLSEEALDETTLRQLAADEIVARRAPRPRQPRSACGTSARRPTSARRRSRTTCGSPGRLFEHLTAGRPAHARGLDRRASSPALDRTDGDIDALSTRLASVRTLAYVANRADWLADPAHWQGRTRALEDRLSDTLHEQLMQRFIDRRTSALMRGLEPARGTCSAGIAADGAVTVEGHFVGRLIGRCTSSPSAARRALEDKALRAAAERAVGPEIARRLGELRGESRRGVRARARRRRAWRGRRRASSSAAARSRRACGCSATSAPTPARERAARRLEAFLAAEAGRRLPPLKRLTRPSPTARSRAWRAASPIGWSSVGVLDRRRWTSMSGR